MLVGWRWLSTKSAGVGEKRLRLTGLIAGLMIFMPFELIDLFRTRKGSPSTTNVVLVLVVIRLSKIS